MRKVQVTIGSPVPHLAEQAPPEMAKIIRENQMTESFCVVFIEDNGQDHLVALMSCLCNLAEMTEAWLTGATIEELQSVIARLVKGSAEP